MKFRVDRDTSPEELRRVVSGGFPQTFTFGGATVEDALENAADLYDAIFEINLMRSVTGIEADLQWTRSEQDNFIAEQVKEWFSIHRPQALQDCEAVLRQYVPERR